MDKVEIDTIFPKNNTATTRGHKYKIYKKHCRTNRRNKGNNKITELRAIKGKSKLISI